MASSSSSSYVSVNPLECEVFLSFRGEDTCKTFVDHLYSALLDRKISTYKDDVALDRGESIRPTLFSAIEGSHIAVVIFSKNYACSSWCLDELEYIMTCKDKRGLIVLPVFYDVVPSEVRKQEGEFGKGFSKQEVKNNFGKVESWRRALVDASDNSGWEVKTIANGHEAIVIKEIIDTISDKLFYSLFDEGLVGMSVRMQQLEEQLDIGSGGVRIVGVWGPGGCGKTTLASSLYLKVSHHFQGHCIIKNVREESSKHGLKALQGRLLSTLLKTKIIFQSVEGGKQILRSTLKHMKVLILIDDVDDCNQLDALVGSHDWFGSGSRIIITTRDVHLLRTHKVDLVYPVRLLSHEEAIQLFNIHAYNQDNRIYDYDTLAFCLVSYAAGRPLAIKVFGSFLYDKNREEWLSCLSRLIDIPEMEIVEQLKIIYDGLEFVEQALFLDIACFFRGKNILDSMELLEACGYHPAIAIKILRQKALITIVNGRFDMHDLVQQMGHYIVRGKHPNSPEKHSRVWKTEEIENMSIRNTIMGNDKIEAMRYNGYSYDQSSSFCKFVSNMKKLRWLEVNMEHEENKKVNKRDAGPRFLSNELCYIDWEGYPASRFPDRFQLTKLVVLKLDTSKLEEVWKGYQHLPNLKVLELRNMKKLLRTPDFCQLPRLQKLILCDCEKLEVIHPSLGNHESLEYVKILYCPKLRLLPTIDHMLNLKTLKIEGCGLEDRKILFGELPKLQELDLSMNSFSRLDFSLLQLTSLRVLNLSWCKNLVELSEFPSSLKILKADYCDSLNNIGDCIRKCRRLCQVSLMGGGIINDGGRLLQSMLEGESIDNSSMLLQLKDFEIPKGFRPGLLSGNRCRLQLPDNWHNSYSGFLMCAVFSYDFHRSDYVRLAMQQVMSGMDSEDDVAWEKGDGDKSTWVWYVPFGSLLRTSCWNGWNRTCKALSFNIQDNSCCGFTATLLSKGSTGYLKFRDTPHFKIEQDSVSDIVLSLKLINNL